jgi:hyaluronoglucosaminidase
MQKNYYKHMKPPFKLILTLLFLSLTAPGYAQGEKILPQPQQSAFTGKRFILNHTYKLIGLKNPDPDAVILLEHVLNNGRPAKKKLPLLITPTDKKDTVLQKSGAYRLDILPSKITIAAFDNRSLFYAAQTLSQLIHKEADEKISLPEGVVNDFPDIAFRGTVEGFYGEPWSHQDRMEQFRFYGKLKLNTYIYGPKDDPYHSSPNWRLPYPDNKAREIKELVTEAGKNKVDFVWAIHPGQDINWNLKDSLAIVNKFEIMYQLGVRSFAVFFDDISGIGTKAEKQAELLNYLQHDFVNKKKDVSALIMCPTEYNKSWADPQPGSYLDILGDQLDPAIHVMWTGNTVVADITKEGLEWVNRRIKRQAYVWWNFPVSDYTRDHLLMGPAYGLDTQASKDMSGFVSNPMDKAEASKTAIFGVALYAWNLAKYDPQWAWDAANQYIMPEAPTAFKLFNSHNSDPGANGHGYRRDESVEIKPAIDLFFASFKQGDYRPDLAAQIKAEFSRIIPVAAEIRNKSTNKRLVEQISPWLTQFELLGKAGVSSMSMLEEWNAKNYTAAASSYLKVDQLLDSMKQLDKKANSPGIKTGSLVLSPFVKNVFKFMGPQISKTSSITMPPSFLFEQAVERSVNYSNSEKLRNQPLIFEENSVAISPALEVKSLNKGEYLGISIDPKLKITQLQFNLESSDLLASGLFQSSADGKNWQTLKVNETKGKGNYAIFTGVEKYIRFLNDSEKTKTFYLKKFKIVLEAVN